MSWPRRQGWACRRGTGASAGCWCVRDAWLSPWRSPQRTDRNTAARILVLYHFYIFQCCAENSECEICRLRLLSVSGTSSSHRHLLVLGHVRKSLLPKATASLPLAEFAPLGSLPLFCQQGRLHCRWGSERVTQGDPNRVQCTGAQRVKSFRHGVSLGLCADQAAKLDTELRNPAYPPETPPSHAPPHLSPPLPSC